MNSRAKGCRGERELAEFLRDRGHTARRGQQFAGGGDSPDVVCPTLPGVHLEVKRVEAGNPYVWLAQAIRDTRSVCDCGATTISPGYPHTTTCRTWKTMPVVAHKRNRQEWIAVLRFEDLLSLLERANRPNPPIVGNL